MAEKQRSQSDIVSVAARIMKDPATVTQRDAQLMAARILHDAENEPQPKKPRPRAKPSIGSAAAKRRSLGTTSRAKKKR
jgi:hypothetical protein